VDHPKEEDISMMMMEQLLHIKILLVQQMLLLFSNIQFQTIHYNLVSSFLVIYKNTLIFLLLGVSAATGSFSTFPATRSYEIQLRGVFPATNVLVNGVSIPVEPFNELINGQDGTTNGYTYDGSSLAIIIYIRQPVSTSQPLQIQVQLSANISHPLIQEAPTSFIGLLARCQSAKAQLDYQWGVRTVFMDDYPLLLDAASTGLRITHSPSTAKDEINAFFSQRMPGACDQVANKITNLDPNLRNILLAQLKCNLFIRK
jgi:hypothetical protein